MGHLGHFVHTHRIHKESRNSHHVSQLLGQICAQIGGMLPVGRLLHIAHHGIADGVGAGGDGPVQAAPAAHSVKIGQLIAALRHRIQNGLLPVVRLINDPVKLIQLLRGVVDALFEDLLVFVEHSDLCGSCAGVDDQNLHPFLLLLSSLIL